jgi:predicted nucleotidyltransferase
MELQSDFQEFFKSLNKHDVEYVVVGAYALAFHGRPRATDDLDVFVAANPHNARRVLAALKDFGFGSLDIKEEDLSTPRFFFRLGRAPNQIDILTNLEGTTWDEVWQQRIESEYGGVPVHVIGREQFIQAKRSSGRLQDLGDIEKLGEVP